MKQIHYFLISVTLSLILFLATVVLIDSKFPEYETSIKPHFNSEPVPTHDYWYFGAFTRTKDCLSLYYHVTLVTKHNSPDFTDDCPGGIHTGDCRHIMFYKHVFIKAASQLYATNTSKIDSTYTHYLDENQEQWTNVIITPTPESAELLEKVATQKTLQVQAEAQVHIAKKQLEAAKHDVYLKSIVNLHKSISKTP